ncbi:hypothetical protein TVAG_159560 [Trichomonas vaginalis G3]|uniref:DUF3447 domain-containing protein n=1 Tax=Trichomonas vaginalis (strain ATCC PRA-98 / G3) TaxID=412133 RepID=A2F5B1_TRIV3|nr:protein of unknown function (DUF3447) [Trichomonas vaginalis G3]EAX99936.1 hypothetical protein TVAG_159560 [Trichomonas vaginalis G3]KAI5547783.1 protein of unknown function (DUF3447) [Trichomonas vaginalis G3]|eukprot:XP_001312866.1 hypothetical protein [Trichomonas vaginalis G3]
MRSYYTLYKMIYEEFHPDIFKEGPNPLNYFLCKELNIPVLDLKIKGKFDKYESKNYSLEIHEPKSIFRAIMENDKETFIGLASNDGFDPKMTIKSDLYPDEGGNFSLIDLCCYHGAVDCFKFLRTEFNSFIGPECLWHSFLGGNQEIMHECLKEYDPDYESMKHSIISHNIDFITYLANEYDLEIQLFYCGIYNNL